MKNKNMSQRNLENEIVSEMNSAVKKIIRNWLNCEGMRMDQWEEIIKKIKVNSPKNFYAIPLISGAFGFTALKDGKEKRYRIILIKADFEERAKLILENHNGREFYEYSMINKVPVLTHVDYETRSRIFTLTREETSIKIMVTIKAKTNDVSGNHYFTWEFAGKQIKVERIMKNWRGLEKFFLRVNNGAGFFKLYKHILNISELLKCTMMPLEKITFKHSCFKKGEEQTLEKIESLDNQIAIYEKREIEGLYQVYADGTYNFWGDCNNFEKDLLFRMWRIFK